MFTERFLKYDQHGPFHYHFEKIYQHRPDIIGVLRGQPNVPCRQTDIFKICYRYINIENGLIPPTPFCQALITLESYPDEYMIFFLRESEKFTPDSSELLKSELPTAVHELSRYKQTDRNRQTNSLQNYPVKNTSPRLANLQIKVLTKPRKESRAKFIVMT